MFEGIELFSSLSPSEQQTLEMFCQERLIKSGEILFEKGDDSTSMYIVKSGLLQAYIGDTVLGNIKPGEFVGEMALFNKPKVRTASVKAIQDTSVIILLSFSIQQLTNSNPKIIESIKEVIESRKNQNENK